jgi:hypothetical protein
MCFGDFHLEQRPTRWIAKFAHSDIEIGLGGDESGPHRANQEMAKACEAQLADLMAKALAISISGELTGGKE